MWSSSNGIYVYGRIMVERFRFGQDYSYSATGCTILIDLSKGIKL